jgi:NifU-like protein involved in Fe-S cluster formation
MNQEHLYKQAIMEHYHNSPHRGQIDNPTFITEETSPSCGDRVIFDVVCNGDTVSGVTFRGEGSILGQAAASMLIDQVLGKDCAFVLAFTEDDMLGWLGIELGPTRKRAVVFVLHTFQKGVREYYARSNKSS